MEYEDVSDKASEVDPGVEIESDLDTDIEDDSSETDFETTSGCETSDSDTDADQLFEVDMPTKYGLRRVAMTKEELKAGNNYGRKADFPTVLR